MATELARVLLEFVNDMVEAVCVRLGPMVGARPKEVKIGLGVALGLIALHRIITAPAKREQPAAAAPRDAARAEARAARPADAAARARETGRAESAATAATAPGADQVKGAKRITVATTGVLLQASGGGMTLIAGAAEALKQAIRGQETYLITQVESDDAENAARAALKDGGLLGTAQGQVAPHRALFCSTSVGRIALVRQICPDLHVDSSYETVKELQRFGTKAVFVSEKGVPEGAQAVPTVTGLPALFSH